MTRQRVVGIGETVLDILFKNDQPEKAIPGGSTFNSIISLGRAHIPCAMVSDVGGDHIGDIICNYMRENGVSTEFVSRHHNNKSHISLAFLDENNDAQYIFYKDHASVILDGNLPQISENDIVLFGSFFAINPTIRPIVGQLLKDAKQAGAWLYYDINFRKPHITDLPNVMTNIEENMRLANLVRGSLDDFYYLYGLNNSKSIYKRVAQFCPNLIITNGAKSVQVYNSNGCHTYPVNPIQTVSTVGAGDNFNAGYIYAIMKGISSESARIDMAQRWSQNVCQQLGNNISNQFAQELANSTNSYSV